MRRAVSFLFFWFVFASFIAGLCFSTYWYWEVRKTPVEITPATSELGGPREAITIRFSQAVQAESFHGKIHIEPAHPFRTEWHDHGRTLLLLPEENWTLEAAYRVTLGTGRTTWFGGTPATSFRVEGPSYPALVSVFPENNAQDILLGVEDPLRVTFDRSVKDFFIDFRLDPPAPVVYRNNGEKTSFEILPQHTLPPGTRHALTVMAKWRGEPDSAYRLLGTTTFATLPPRPESWSEDLALRAEEAKRFTRPRKLDGKYIDINIESQVMTLFENGQVLEAYSISSGKPGMDTPRGEFAVENKAKRPWSKRYSLFMPFWQAITPDGLFGIHELPEWPGGYKEGANHLGTPVSHGCVRLGVGAAERVYAWTEIGTPIIIY